MKFRSTQHSSFMIILKVHWRGNSKNMSENRMNGTVSSGYFPIFSCLAQIDVPICLRSSVCDQQYHVINIFLSNFFTDNSDQFLFDKLLSLHNPFFPQNVNKKFVENSLLH